jgi:septum formation protein
MTLHFILGSASPRRRDLFQRLGLSFTVKPVDIHEESHLQHGRPSRTVLDISREKMAALEIEGPFDKSAILVTADTIVYYRGVVLGKPESKEEAGEMLRRLSGHAHTVYTGVVIKRGEERKAFYEKTRVRFMPLSPELIRRYLETGEYEGKAGAYAIQGKGAFFISSIRGDYYNVVGFPVNAFIRTLSRCFGVALL